MSKGEVEVEVEGEVKGGDDGDGDDGVVGEGEVTLFTGSDGSQNVSGHCGSDDMHVLSVVRYTYGHYVAGAHLALLVDERGDGFHELVLRIVPVVLQDSL